jgi:cytoplasmic iron level regulating protein YaaA (DUF328/UPF0246 family)
MSKLSTKKVYVMIILLAPSESKSQGGDNPKVDFDKFLFAKEQKRRVATFYNDLIKKADVEELKELFGLKKESDIDRYRDLDILNSPTKKAIERYTGVAFSYLDYASLHKDLQKRVDRSVIIFSNIFGPLRADESIPDYRLKQGSKLTGLSIEKLYKENSKELDEYLKDKLVIDLRAGYYEKFYTPKEHYITMKFIKNGKVVSHWAKAYRGLITKELSYHDPKSQKELQSIEFENLKISEIREIGKKREYIYEIVE